MKKILRNKHAYTKVVGGLVALLITIAIGVMIFWEVQTGVEQFGAVVEEFGPYADTTNASAWSVILENSPNSASDVNVTCVNFTGNHESYPAFGLNHRTISVAADAADNFTQVNVTYTSHLAADEDAGTNMASTVFALAPIIALVVVASVILVVVLGFGGGKKGGGL